MGKLYLKPMVEFHGSLMMAFIVYVSGGNGIAIVWGLFMCVVAAGAAFFNPCISLACIFRDYNQAHQPLEKSLETVLCMCTQILGYFCGALIGWAVEGDTLAIMINPEKDKAQAFFTEVVWTGQLILTLMIIKDLKTWKDPHWVAIFSVIITVWVMANMAGPISGGCFNPTLCITVNIVHYMNTEDHEALKHLWVYAFAPLIGTMVAAGAAGALRTKASKPMNEVHEVKQLQQEEEESDENHHH